MNQNGDLLYSVDYIAGGNGIKCIVRLETIHFWWVEKPKVYSVYNDLFKLNHL